MSNNVEVRFLEPFDILLFRGNKLFGDPGSFGESLVLPWPSQVAGALRSRLLVEGGVELSEFASGQKRHSALGTPEEPGPFTVALCSLARRFADGRVELVVPPPADAVVADAKGGARPAIRLLRPERLANLPLGWGSSYPLSLLPVLPLKKQAKPMEGWWLTESGWKKYLRGQSPNDPATDLIPTGSLWSLDARVGIGLSRASRAAEEGRLFSNRTARLPSGSGSMRARKRRRATSGSWWPIPTPRRARCRRERCCAWAGISARVPCAKRRVTRFRRPITR